MYFTSCRQKLWSYVREEKWKGIQRNLLIKKSVIHRLLSWQRTPKFTSPCVIDIFQCCNKALKDL